MTVAAAVPWYSNIDSCAHERVGKSHLTAKDWGSYQLHKFLIGKNGDITYQMELWRLTE
jgi:hypothetical protein